MILKNKNKWVEYGGNGYYLYGKNLHCKYYLISLLNGFSFNKHIIGGAETIEYLEMNLEDAKAYVISYRRKEKIKKILE